MKKSVVLFLSVLCFFYCSAQKENNTSGEIKIAEIYLHWITSMCAQNCENISVENYEITKPLTCVEPYSRGNLVFIEGNFVTVDELITVAGPDSDFSDMNKTHRVKKIEVNKQIKLDTPELMLDSTNKELYKNKENYVLNITFKNPTDEEITLFVGVDNLKKQKLTIGAVEKKTIPYLVTKEASGMKDHDLHIYNFDNSDENLVKNLKKAEKTGLIIFIRKHFSIESILR